MGIIIIPFLLGALIIGIMAIIKTTLLLSNKEIVLKDFLYGLLTTIGIFGMICISYLIQDKAWALSPAFRIPIGLFFIPYFIYFILTTNRITQWNHLSKNIIISITISTILSLIFHDELFNLVSLLGVKEHY